MKIKLIILTILLSSTFAFSQEQEKFNRQELGIAFSNFKFDNVGLSYRIGSESGLWRVGLSSNIYKNTSDIRIDSLNSNTDDLGRGISFKLGREQRITVAEGLKVRIGGELGYSRYNNNGEINDSIYFSFYESESISNSYSFALVIGSIYQINKNIYVGFEFLPSYGIHKIKRFNKSDDGTVEREFDVSNSSLNFNFNSTTFLLNIGFNF